MSLDRRAFVEWTAAAAAGVVLPGCASLRAVAVTPEDGIVRVVLRNHPGLATRGGSLKLLPTGWPHPIYLLALDRGYAAVSPICTHQGCTVGIERDVLVCPCHGSTYDREGTVLRGPAQNPLRRFPTILGQDGVLAVDVRGATS